VYNGGSVDIIAIGADTIDLRYGVLDEIVYLVPPYSYSTKSKASRNIFFPKQVQVIRGHAYKKDNMVKTKTQRKV
jgi:hypothetical protein